MFKGLRMKSGKVIKPPIPTKVFHAELFLTF